MTGMEFSMHAKVLNRFAFTVALVLLGMAQAGNADMDPQAEATARTAVGSPNRRASSV